jgi:two-component system cell cycle response regulator
MSYNEKYLELKSSGSLPSPTGTAMKLIELCQQSNVALPEIVHAMQADPGLVGRVLKMANSPMYGRLRPVVSLSPDVLMTIGIQSLRQVVLAFSLVSSHRKGQCKGFDYQEFWSRSIAIGVAAELIGAEARIAPPVEMFTCGLLSQVGKLALAAIHRDKYGQVVVEAGNDHERLLQLEEESFGLNHAEISAAMMADWGIPKFFSEAVLYQELPGLAGFSENSRRARLIWCFHLAWQLAALCFTVESQRSERMAALYPIGRKLDLDADMLVSIANQMLLEWKEWSALLEIPVQHVAAFPHPPQETPPVDTAMTSDFTIGQAKEQAPADILVVDNDPASVELLKTILVSAGHKVHTAANGRDALRMVLEHQPQIMITDWMMPGIDGLQLLRTLRETEIGRYLYVMVLTAQSDREKLVEAFNAGADDYLVKPMERMELLARLKAGVRIVTVQREVINECDLLRRNALQLTIANQRAEEAALTDSLTGLYNRRYAMDRLAREWVASERNHRPLSILLLDIDHFKTVNDNHGHNIGDIALKRMAEMLAEYSRRPDIACRIGGEEFFILAPETALPGAIRQAERLREAFEGKPITVEGIDLPLTVSVGVAQKVAGMSSPEELLKVADEALYRAKREGRNRVIAAPLA